MIIHDYGDDDDDDDDDDTLLKHKLGLTREMKTVCMFLLRTAEVSSLQICVSVILSYHDNWH